MNEESEVGGLSLRDPWRGVAGCACLWLLIPPGYEGLAFRTL